MKTVTKGAYDTLEASDEEEVQVPARKGRLDKGKGRAIISPTPDESQSGGQKPTEEIVSVNQHQNGEMHDGGIDEPEEAMMEEEEDDIEQDVMDVMAFAEVDVDVEEPIERQSPPSNIEDKPIDLEHGEDANQDFVDAMNDDDDDNLNFSPLHGNLIDHPSPSNHGVEGHESENDESIEEDDGHELPPTISSKPIHPAPSSHPSSDHDGSLTSNRPHSPRRASAPKNRTPPPPVVDQDIPLTTTKSLHSIPQPNVAQFRQILVEDAARKDLASPDSTQIDEFSQSVGAVEQRDEHEHETDLVDESSRQPHLEREIVDVSSSVEDPPSNTAATSIHSSLGPTPALAASQPPPSTTKLAKSNPIPRKTISAHAIASAAAASPAVAGVAIGGTKTLRPLSEVRKTFALSAVSAELERDDEQESPKRNLRREENAVRAVESAMRADGSSEYGPDEKEGSESLWEGNDDDDDRQGISGIMDVDVAGALAEDDVDGKLRSPFAL